MGLVLHESMKASGPHRTKAIPIEHFKEAARFDGEHEEGTTADVLLELFADQHQQAIVPAPHIAGFHGHENLEAAGKT